MAFYCCVYNMIVKLSLNSSPLNYITYCVNTPLMSLNYIFIFSLTLQKLIPQVKNVHTCLYNYLVHICNLNYYFIDISIKIVAIV